MSSATPTKILHLIDDDGTLETASNIASFIQQEIAVAGKQTDATGSSSSDSNDDFELITSPTQVGLRYRLIAVFGGQSSGKSTLLNRLFGTHFVTMDSSKGRQQTTKGAFFSKAPVGNNNVFVTDFEGTDGVERGEDQSFERQLSLFALSCADTLIINMWCHEVGRFNGANLALLRTVFEVNLQLFSHIDEEAEGGDLIVDQRDKEKPTLLFVLRDWDGTQEQAALYSGVRKSLEVVWEKVTKPKKFETAALRDLFDIKYEALPHFTFQKKEFEAACEKLKGNFIDSKSAGYMFKSSETFRGVPLEALPQYLTSCWESIRTSKDLNIPSQRSMLAQVRCGEAAGAALADFKATTGVPFHDRIKRQERIPKLNKTLEDKMEELVEGYKKSTKLYGGPAAAKNEDYLRKGLEKACAKLVSYQCRQIAAEEMDNCEGKVQKVLDVAIKGLHEQASKACVEEKEAGEGSDFDWETTNNKIITQFWQMIRSGVKDLVDDVTKILAAKGEGKNSAVLNADPEGLSRVLLLLKEAADKKIQSRLEAMAADPQATMTKQFEHALDKDPVSGSLRTFRNKNSLEKAYKPAAHTGVLLLGCLFALRLSESTAPDADIFLGLSGPTNSEEPAYPTSALERLANDLETIEEEDVVVDLCESEEEEEEEVLDDDLAFTMTSSRKKKVEAAAAAASSKSPTKRALASAAAVAALPTVAVLLNKEAVSRAFEMYSKECSFTLKLRLQQIDSGTKSLPGWVYMALVFLGANEFYYALTNPLVLIVLIVVAYFFLQSFAQEQFTVLEEKAPAVALMLKAGWATVEPHFDKIKAQITNVTAASGNGGSGAATPRGGPKPVKDKKQD